MNGLWLLETRRKDLFLRRTLVTKKDLSEILSGLLHHPDSPVNGMHCSISSSKPFERFTLTVSGRTRQDHSVSITLVLRDQRGSKCTINIFLNDTRRIPLDVEKQLKNIIRAYWKPQHRSGPSGLIDLKRNRKVRLIAERTFSDSMNASGSFSILCCDLDNFKRVNSQFGRDVGDKVIKEFAALLESEVSEVAIPLHDGGDEFVVLFPQSDTKRARVLASRIQLATASHDFGLGMSSMKVSIGIATALTNHHSGFKTLMEDSYRFMEQSKRSTPR